MDSSAISLLLGLIGALALMWIMSKLPAPPPLNLADDRPDPVAAAQGIGVLSGIVATMAIGGYLLIARLPTAKVSLWTWRDSAWLVVLPSLPLAGKWIGDRIGRLLYRPRS